MLRKGSLPKRTWKLVERDQGLGQQFLANTFSGDHCMLCTYCFSTRLLYKECVWIVGISNEPKFPWRLPKLHKNKCLYHDACQWRASLKVASGNLEKLCLNSVNVLKCCWNAVSVNWNTEQCSFLWIKFLLYIPAKYEQLELAQNEIVALYIISLKFANFSLMQQQSRFPLCFLQVYTFLTELTLLLCRYFMRFSEPWWR